MSLSGFIYIYFIVSCTAFGDCFLLITLYILIIGVSDWVQVALVLREQSIYFV